MKSSDQKGFYLFAKSQGTQSVLKEMLQYLRSTAPGKSLQFAYVESETSLLPNLTLWENLHVVVGGSSWKEFTAGLSVDWHPLINLVRDPHVEAKDATSWERLTISLIKANLISTHNIIIDLNEGSHSQLNLMNFKKILVSLAEKKNVYIASEKPDIWIDSTHSLISRNGYEFVVEQVSAESIKRRSA